MAGFAGVLCEASQEMVMVWWCPVRGQSCQVAFVSELECRADQYTSAFVFIVQDYVFSRG